MIQHSLQAWATSLGMERRTLETRLVKAGFTVPKKDGNGVSAKKVFVALLGEADAEKNRLTSAQAQKVERENAEASGIIQSRELVEASLWDNGLSKVREAWQRYPQETGGKLRTLLSTAGVENATAEKIIAEACAGVTACIETLNATLTKKR